MQLIEIDAIDAKPRQTSFELLTEMFGPAIRRPLVRSRPIQSAFRRDDHAMGIGMQRFCDKRLADVRPIRLRGIDEGDAEFHGASQCRNRFCTIAWRSPGSRSRD